MICPKCKITGYGPHCKYCGEKMTEETELNETRAQSSIHDTARIAPADVSKRPAHYSDDNYDINRAADSEYYDTDKDISGYSYYEEEKKDSKKILIGVLSASAVILLIISFFLAKALFFPGQKVQTVPEDKPRIEKKNETDELMDMAEKYMKIDDFENAEKIYYRLTELTDDENVSIMYDILHGYNQALLKYEEADYERAKDFYDRIPVEYIDYDISAKIDKLGDNIENGIKAYEIFENIEKYMKDKDIDAAEEEMGILESKYLSKEDSDRLDEIKKEIEKINKDKKEFTSPEAESFLQEYCYAMEKAVNAGDFGLVSKYLDSSAYITQNDAVDYCVSEGITKKFGSLRIKSLTETDSNKWEAQVSETETVTFDDGTEETKSYSRTYTVEYINSAYYITAINGD